MDKHYQWSKKNLKSISQRFKKEFVDEFRDACDRQGIKQSQVIKEAMINTIKGGYSSMRDLMELVNDFPKTFGYCRTKEDVIEKLDALHTSREILYLNDKGIGTYDINDNVPLLKDGKYFIAKGYFTVEFRENGLNNIKIATENIIELDSDMEVSSETVEIIGLL